MYMNKNHNPSTPVLLVDGHNLLWRAAFGFPARITTLDSRDVTAEFGFFALLRVAQRELAKQTECIVCFDGQYGLRSRQSLNSEYKANRGMADLSPIQALPAIQAALMKGAIASLEFDDLEADDLIASLCAQAAPRKVFIMSSDKDYFQLLSDRVSILNTARKRDQRIFRKEHLRGTYQVTPEQWCDFRALMGDPADNICGVQGIGKKMAAKLLEGGKTLEGLGQGVAINGMVGLNLRERWAQVLLDRELMRLRNDLPLAPYLTGEATPEMPTAATVLDGISLWDKPWEDRIAGQETRRMENLK